MEKTFKSNFKIALNIVAWTIYVKSYYELIKMINKFKLLLIYVDKLKV
jgi:hypothetical protein